MAVSNGSLKFNVGTAAFIIVATHNVPPVISTHVVPGKAHDGESLHCKHSGLYGIDTVVASIIQQFHLTQGSIHVACDNEQALCIFHSDFIPDPQQANFDLTNAVVYSLRSLPLHWSCERVCGHQDSKLRHQTLSQLEELNVCMDKLAQIIWIHYTCHYPDLTSPPANPYPRQRLAGMAWGLKTHQPIHNESLRDSSRTDDTDMVDSTQYHSPHGSTHR